MEMKQKGMGIIWMTRSQDAAEKLMSSVVTSAAMRKVRIKRVKPVMASQRAAILPVAKPAMGMAMRTAIPPAVSAMPAVVAL